MKLFKVIVTDFIPRERSSGLLRNASSPVDKTLLFWPACQSIKGFIYSSRILPSINRNGLRRENRNPPLPCPPSFPPHETTTALPPGYGLGKSKAREVMR